MRARGSSDSLVAERFMRFGCYHFLVSDSEFGSKEFDELVPVEQRLPAARAVIRIDIHKAQTSSGYGIPIMQFVDNRETVNQWGEGVVPKVRLRLPNSS